MSAEVTKKLTEDGTLLCFSPQREAKTQLEKAHLLSRNNLLSAEAKRISSILENCISHVEIAVTLAAVPQSDSISGVASDEMSRALREHRILCERLETLDGLELTSHGEPEGEVGKARERTKAQLERAVKDSFRNLLRLVPGKPDAISSLKAELGTGAGESEYLLIEGLKDFHGKVREQLLTSPEEVEMPLLSQQTSSPGSENVEELIAEVAAAMKETDAKITEQENEIQNLERSLKETDAEEVDVSLIAEKQCQAYIKTAKVRQASKQQEIDQLNIQLSNLSLEYRNKEIQIQMETEKVKMEIEDLLQKFDEKMEETQANLEKSQIELEVDEEELRNLEKLYTVLELEYNEVQERRRLAEEKRRAEMKDLVLKTKAAILAQSWWRGYSVRKAMKNKGKSKKPKKGKGKKKK